MKHPDSATHMVSLPDGAPCNNELGYCSSPARNPNVVITLTPAGSAWSKWTLQGTKVIVKWLKLAGEPEFLHVLDGETSTTTRLPRRLLQRHPADIVTIKTGLGTNHPAGTVLYYGLASAFAENTISVTPLGTWRYDLPMGSSVEISNLSDPSNPVKSGLFGSQSNAFEKSSGSVKFLKDSPGG
jgi:hypothetical protein